MGFEGWVDTFINHLDGQFYFARYNLVRRERTVDHIPFADCLNTLTLGIIHLKPFTGYANSCHSCRLRRQKGKGQSPAFATFSLSQFLCLARNLWNTKNHPLSVQKDLSLFQTPNTTRQGYSPYLFSILNAAHSGFEFFHISWAVQTKTLHWTAKLSIY